MRTALTLVLLATLSACGPLDERAVPGSWTGTLRPDGVPIDVVAEFYEDHTAAARPTAEVDHGGRTPAPTPGVAWEPTQMEWRYTWAYDAGTVTLRPAAGAIEHAPMTARLEGGERPQLIGDSLSLVREDGGERQDWEDR